MSFDASTALMPAPRRSAGRSGAPKPKKVKPGKGKMSYINKALTVRKSDLVAARADVRDAVASSASTGLGAKAAIKLVSARSRRSDRCGRRCCTA
jgi:hypothetical protein